jgi:hypothetical protein
MTAVACPLIGHAQTTSGLETCTDASRQCMIASAMSYLDGLIKADGSKVRLARNVRRTETGTKTAIEGDEALRAAIGRERLKGRRNLRFFVEEPKHEVIAFWLAGTSNPQSPSAHIAERIKVDAGLITEIEVFWASDDRAFEASQSGWPDEPE